MRKSFSAHIEKLVETHDNIVFVTGDLGFNALESLQNKMGDRFINAGVAEQNMVGMAAGIASQGFHVICYSIAPFAVYRCLEQIRNDVCFHNLPVYIVGNGGGYGYGIMGSSHHAIEDIGSMRIFPNMKVYVPFTKKDVYSSLKEMIDDPTPNYLRLNLASNQEEILSFSQWRQIKKGKGFSKAIVIGTGTVVDNLFKLSQQILDDLDIWLLSKFPVYDVPAELIERISEVKNVIVIEEHQGQCSLHETLASLLLKQLKTPIEYHTLFASGYPSGRYGSQQWHLEENNLAGKNLENKIDEFLSHYHAV